MIGALTFTALLLAALAALHGGSGLAAWLLVWAAALWAARCAALGLVRMLGGVTGRPPEGR